MKGFHLRGCVPAILVLATLIAGCSTADTLSTSQPVASAVSFTEPARYAAIVVDANTGRTLYAQNSDQSRIPASLTKMMTLYILFEAMKQGRVTLSTPIPVSAHAASQAPTKIGFRPGDSIDVDSAIKAVVTKSANDVAVAIAEYLAGSEPQFTTIMNAKAMQLGMNGTHFQNASGLPDPEQRTTARDMAVLGLALRQRFPQYYSYFSVQDFAWRGRMIKGHNKVLDQVAGADGIKTGYTKMSGYNIVTSVNNGGRKLVAVVMGEDTAKERNDHVADLVSTYMPAATAR